MRVVTFALRKSRFRTHRHCLSWVRLLRTAKRLRRFLHCTCLTSDSARCRNPARRLCARSEIFGEQTWCFHAGHTKWPNYFRALCQWRIGARKMADLQWNKELLGDRGAGCRARWIVQTRRSCFGYDHGMEERPAQIADHHPAIAQPDRRYRRCFASSARVDPRSQCHGDSIVGVAEPGSAFIYGPSHLQIFSELLRRKLRGRSTYRLL